jgi:hypothetical protein
MNRETNRFKFYGTLYVKIFQFLLCKKIEIYIYPYKPIILMSSFLTIADKFNSTPEYKAALEELKKNPALRAYIKVTERTNDNPEYGWSKSYTVVIKPSGDLEFEDNVYMKYPLLKVLIPRCFTIFFDSDENCILGGNGFLLIKIQNINIYIYIYI